MTLITNPPRIAMVAGEPSGDLLAASLLKGLAQTLPEGTRYSGIGGPRSGGPPLAGPQPKKK